MSRRRFIADEISGDNAAVIGEHAHHLARVLRARVGQEFDIATGTSVRTSRITAIKEGRVEFAMGEEIWTAPNTRITLLLAVFKFDRMEWAIEKCAELGVASIVPFIAKRTDTHLAAASAKRVERWRRIARQASEQSRRAIPPEITAPMRLPQALQGKHDRRIVLSEVEGGNLLRHALQSQKLNGIALAIGPEGGWTPEELELFDSSGWISVSLGPTILRAETAAIAATAIVLSSLQT